MEETGNLTIKCPGCDSNVPPLIKAEFGYTTLITSVLLVLFFNFWSILFLPFTIPLTKCITIRCSQCEILIKKQSPFGSNSLSDQILTFKIGDFAVILSRKYLITAFAIVLCTCWLLFPISQNSLEISPITWPEYLNDCSAEKIIRDKENVQLIFAQLYYGKVVNWDGYLMKASINEGWFQGQHAAVLLVKMQPSESDIYADLVLTMSQEDFLLSKDQIVLLDRGSHFSFNATLTAVGDEEAIHHLHAHGIYKLEGFLEIATQMRNNFRNTASSPSVEIISIVDKPIILDHDHTHYYNQTYNQTLE